MKLKPLWIGHNTRETSKQSTRDFHETQVAFNNEQSRSVFTRELTWLRHQFFLLFTVWLSTASRKSRALSCASNFSSSWWKISLSKSVNFQIIGVASCAISFFCCPFVSSPSFPQWKSSISGEKLKRRKFWTLSALEFFLIFLINENEAKVNFLSHTFWMGG